MIYFLSMASTPSGVCLYLSGEIDLSVSDHLYEALHGALDQTVGPIEVNLRGLRLLDCTGLTALLRARDDAHRCGRVLFVSQARGTVRRVLGLAAMLSDVPADVPLASSRPCAADSRPLTRRSAVRRLPTRHRSYLRPHP